MILIGNLGRDFEVRNTQQGSKIVSMTIAASDQWTDRASGERKERTEWHRVVILNERLAELAERYLKKGAKVYVEGALHTRKWTDQQGQDRYSTEVVLGRFNSELTMLDGRAGAGDQDGGSSGGSPETAHQPYFGQVVRPVQADRVDPHGKRRKAGTWMMEIPF